MIGGRGGVQRGRCAALGAPALAALLALAACSNSAPRTDARAVATALTPAPSRTPEFRPPPDPQPDLPALPAASDPVVISSALGRALAGAITTDPRTGRPWFTWSQLNTDPGYERSGRIYLQTTNSRSGAFAPARTVNAPGYYKIEQAGPESAVAVGPDGRAHVIYVRNPSPDGAHPAVVDYRTSTDDGQTWDGPVSLPDPAGSATVSLRLGVDRANAAHIAYVTKPDGARPGVIHYFESRPDGSWRAETPPVRGGARQYLVDFALVDLPAGGVRTVLGWVGDAAVYTAYKDGPDGAWSPPLRLIDGAAQPYGIADYAPHWTPLRAISFRDARGRSWVYLWWSLYSTGRIAFADSSDGGVTWGPRTRDGWREDAIAYYNRAAQPTPQPGERSRGALQYAAPFWDPARQRLVVIYQFCDRSVWIRARRTTASRPTPMACPGRPARRGRATRTFDREPRRLFRTTYSAHGAQFTVTRQPAGANGLVWLMWVEQSSVDQLYLAAINPATLDQSGRRAGGGGPMTRRPDPHGARPRPLASPPRAGRRRRRVTLPVCIAGAVGLFLALTACAFLQSGWRCAGGPATHERVLELPLGHALAQRDAAGDLCPGDRHAERTGHAGPDRAAVRPAADGHAAGDGDPVRARGGAPAVRAGSQNIFYAGQDVRLGALRLTFQDLRAGGVQPHGAQVWVFAFAARNEARRRAGSLVAAAARGA